MDDLYFEKIKKQVLEDRGLDLAQYSRPYVERRLSARMMALSLKDLREYLPLLREDRDEYPALLDAFSINTTEFFRDAAVWKELSEKYFPGIITKKALTISPALRIWSCACSTGEEPYTIAMLVQEALLKTGLKNKIQLTLLATDIDKDALEKARKGEYLEQSMKNIPEYFRKRYFTQLKPEKEEPAHPLSHLTIRHRISEEITKLVDFRQHNFIKDKPFLAMDIIFCRNVIIYLTPEMKSVLIEKFYHSLVPESLLIIGCAELLLSTKETRYFRILSSKNHIYAKDRRQPERQLHYPSDKEKRKNFYPGG